MREQAELVVDRLRRTGTMTFRALCGDAPDTLTTVARFLALLELFRENAVAFDQVSPLGELTVRWTGADDPTSWPSSASTSSRAPRSRRSARSVGRALVETTSVDRPVGRARRDHAHEEETP